MLEKRKWNENSQIMQYKNFLNRNIVYSLAFTRGKKILIQFLVDSIYDFSCHFLKIIRN